jgi:ubiquitin-like modifier-activating enzyme ATG7
MPLLQFASFSSVVQPPFWHKLTEVKIDVLRLSDAPISIVGSYTPGRTIKDRETGADVALGSHFSVGNESFDLNTAQ